MKPLVEFLAGSGGRVLRAIVGIILIALGVKTVGAGGIALDVVGAIFVLAGVFGVCLLGPMAGLPIAGSPKPK